MTYAWISGKKRRATFGTGETLQYSFKSEVEIHCDRRGRDLHNPDAGVMIIWYDQISWRMMLIMRGSAGLSAITFVILVAVLVYRVNVAYFKKRSDNGK